MHIKYPLLLPIIGHGATDIVDLPIATLQIHFLSGILIYLLREKSTTYPFSIRFNYTYI